MALHAALAAAATLISLAFALSTLERWLARRRRHELAWTISLFFFAVASAALWAGGALGWSQANFRLFYLFGAALNVPFLALGTVYLLAGERRGDRWAATVSLLAAFATGVILVAPMKPITDSSALPQGSALFGPLPRIIAASYSGIAATVIIVGAVMSAVRLLRKGSAPGAAISAKRLAAANILIALGTLVTGASGAMNGILNEMDAFAILLVVGISLIFLGFLLTNTAQGARPALRSLSWVDEPPAPLPAEHRTA